MLANTSTPRRRTGYCLIVLLATLMSLNGCSLKTMAINRLGDAVAAGGAGAFASDDDPELIRHASPFSLKMIESLLLKTPRHQGLLTAAASGFTQYTFAFVQQDADRAEHKDVGRAQVLRQRCARLYLRARDYGLRGLDVAHEGFSRRFLSAPQQAVRSLSKQDVDLVYWTAASWAAAISMSKHNPELIADLDYVEALIDRALILDESYGKGAIHQFLITYEAVRPGATNRLERQRHHFERVVQLTNAQLATPFVTYAEQVAVPQQDAVQFRGLLGQALAIDVHGRREWSLENQIMQQRARWLLSRAEELILTAALPPSNSAIVGGNFQ